MALLGTARSRNAFVRALAEVRAKYPFALVGYVVMPEHLHLLIAEPEARKPIGSCAQPETARFQANASQGPQEIGFTEIVRI
jgi:REP element-mobilizing transposase RayT